MTHKPQGILKEIGTLSASLFVAFVLFMGVMIVRGAFTEPAQAPPNANTAPPFTTSDEKQVANQKEITVKDIFAWDLPAANGSGALGEWISSYTTGRKRYQAAASMKSVGVPLNMSAMYELCRDDDGCRITLSIHDYDDADLLNGRPGMVQSKGPFMLFISTTPTSNWWKTSPQGGEPERAKIGKYYKPIIGGAQCQDTPPGPTDQGCILENSYYQGGGIFPSLDPYPLGDLNAFFFGTEGRDNNGIIETVLKDFDCRVTDGEYPATPGDTQAQFSLYMQGSGGKYATQPTWCLFDVED